MANQPESATYDAGVYQLEVTDPVQGGVGGTSNTPLLNLANRTTWLKQQVDALNSAQGGLAPINSPTFTGTPAATTPPAGDNTTKLATTAFVQKAIGGPLTKSVAGSGTTALTAAEAGNGILIFTGALTGARTVTVPASPARFWVVDNRTTGAFTLTVKTPSGTGVVVAQGKRMAIACDGTNVIRADDDFTDAALLGTPTTPTPTAGDNSTKVASTAFVSTAIANAGAQFTTGDIKPTFKAEADSGWVMLNDGTIGSASSSASTRANADTQPLYELLWNNITDTWCPVIGGRGASAAADFIANKRLTLPRALGRAMAGAGAGSGLTSRPLGAYVGTETHTLIEAELPPHTHTATTASSGSHTHTAVTDVQGDHYHQQGSESLYNFYGGGSYVGMRDWSVGTQWASYTNQNTSTAGAHQHSLTTSTNGAHTHTVTVNSTGSGSAHPNMQPTFFVRFMCKL